MQSSYFFKYAFMKSKNGFIQYLFSYFVDTMNPDNEDCNFNIFEGERPDSPPILPQLFSESDSSDEITFPASDLFILSRCVKAFSWSVPVEPDLSLEKVLLACNALAESGNYENCPHFKQFLEDVALNVFDKLLCDKVGQNWEDIINVRLFLSLTTFSSIIFLDIVFLLFGYLLY